MEYDSIEKLTRSFVLAAQSLAFLLDTSAKARPAGLINESRHDYDLNFSSSLEKFTTDVY